MSTLLGLLLYSETDVSRRFENENTRKKHGLAEWVEERVRHKVGALTR